ncbi:hypothetical protein B7P43_G03402 [Cryptotermes secundus]|uniref:DUF4817 domain-containing protein n=1 Tax=Cryptotermes secundus TaxID=105785 RepID=A0A2J7QH92_9NEOP|nr:hypothetical protein B7P43_G03402 [Cryptotermes secundus]
MGLYTLEQRVFLYDTYVKCGSAGKCKFPTDRQFYNLVNRLEPMGLLIDNRTKNDDVEVRLEHTPSKSLKPLAREIGASTPSARMAPKLLKLEPCKTKKSQPHYPASRVHFSSWFLQSSPRSLDRSAIDRGRFPRISCDLRIVTSQSRTLSANRHND